MLLKLYKKCVLLLGATKRCSSMAVKYFKYTGYLNIKIIILARTSDAKVRGCS